jgi:hypothetical protein
MGRKMRAEIRQEIAVIRSKKALATTSPDDAALNLFTVAARLARWRDTRKNTIYRPGKDAVDES